MSIGKLAITSKIPAFDEIIVHQQNGFIASEQKDYTAIISNIFNDDIDVAFISKNAKDTVANRFSSNKIIEENIGYYKSLLKP